MWYFAEGTTLPSFDEYITIQNPDVIDANVTVEYLAEAGCNAAHLLTSHLVSAQTRSTIVVNSPDEVGIGCVGVSAIVRSDVAVVVERPLYFDTSIGGALASPATVDASAAADRRAAASASRGLFIFISSSPG